MWPTDNSVPNYLIFAHLRDHTIMETQQASFTGLMYIKPVPALSELQHEHFVLITRLDDWDIVHIFICIVILFTCVENNMYIYKYLDHDDDGDDGNAAVTTENVDD